MLITLRKYWYHLAIWAIMFIYLMVAPSVHVRYFLKLGKPVLQDLELPASTDQILFSIDRLDPIYKGGQDLFYLWGWAFLTESAMESVYERWIVLSSDSRTYYFAIESLERPEVQKAFEYLDMNLLDAGLLALIAKEAVKPGIYRIGILFVDKRTQSTHYTLTNKTLIRTANQLELQLEIQSQVHQPPVTTPQLDILGIPAQFNHELPPPTNLILSSIDRIDPVTLNGQELYYLWGWAFLQSPTIQDALNRWLVLQPETESDIGANPIFFPAKTFERPDVQQAFERMDIDLLNSGFSTYLSLEAIPIGAYRIGIAFMDKNNSNLYYTLTEKLLVREDEQFRLEPSQ